MANAERGEVGLVVTRIKDGHDEQVEYTLKLSMNAAAQMEADRKMPLGQIVAQIEKMSILAIRDLAFVLLQKHHKAEVKSVQIAGDILDECGIVAFCDAFRRLMEVNQPPETKADSANPPTAQGSTGDDSTLTPAVAH